MKDAAAFVMMLTVTVATLSAGESPRAMIIGKDMALKKAIARLEKSPSDASRDEVRRITAAMFDYAALARSVVPALVWDTCGVDLRSGFVRAFGTLIERTSLQKLVVYQADSSRYDSAAVNGNRASLTAHLWKDGIENVLIYKMAGGDSGWKVIDLVINDLSTARSYREQFTTLFASKTMAEVIAIIDRKTSEGTAAK